MSRVTSDSERVAELVTWGFLDVTWGIMNIATAAIFMLLINWQIGLDRFPGDTSINYRCGAVQKENHRRIP